MSYSFETIFYQHKDRFVTDLIEQLRKIYDSLRQGTYSTTNQLIDNHPSVKEIEKLTLERFGMTMEISKAVKEIKQGKIDFKVDKAGIVHASIGKVSFEPHKIVENAREFLFTINKLKPSSAKGTYIRSIFLSSTMSPGLKVDPKSRDV